MRKDITDFWKMSQSHSLMKQTLQNPRKGKAIGKVFLKEWYLWVSILKAVFEKRFQELRTACFKARFMDCDFCFYYLSFTAIAEAAF